MTVVAVLALLIWLYLLFAHGRYWQSGPVLPFPAARGQDRLPPVCVVVPARDEAAVIEPAVHSLLAQDYAGDFRVIVVDDRSTDGTGDILRRIADPRLTVVAGTPRPIGWSGKLWALAQGIGEAEEAEFLLLTDADIVHAPPHLAALVEHAMHTHCDLVSEMVTLNCESAAERALVPAFIYFFQLLYPFSWVNDPLRATAAAAGGTILVRTRALERIGGIEAVRGALIDDVALAAKVKAGGRIWLGHSTMARSMRVYPGFGDIWNMVARTAYVQLRFSPLLLLLTLILMALTWVVPPVATIFGHGAARWIGVATWIALAWTYLPTLHRYSLSWIWAPFLPANAAFYGAATLGAAVNHYAGSGVSWKGRFYRPGGS
jgi:hopene-associated glycosyltransferase HpnB